MQKLRQYVDLIQQFKVRKQEILAVLGNEQTKTYRFFDGLATHRWFDDEDAIVQELYGVAYDTQYAPYRALKTSLKKKLKNLLFLIDFKQPDILNAFQQTHYEALRTEGAIKILSGRSKMNATVDLCHQLLETALKFEMTYAVVVASQQLRNYYCYWSPNQKKYEYYRDLHNQYFDYHRLENLAESYYCEVSGNFVNNRSTKKWMQPIAQDYLAKLLPHKETVETIQFLRFLGMIELFTHMVVNDYRSTLAVCDEYIAKLERKPFFPEAALIMFYHPKMVCHLMLREHGDSWATARKVSKWVIGGSHNWFKDCTLRIQLCLHTGRNQEALKTFLEVFKHEEFKNQSDSIQEELTIYQGYIQWLIAFGKIQPSKTESKQIGSFSLPRFMNSVHTVEQDKRGLNIPVLMLQILWVVFQKDYNSFIQRLDALRQYKRRYLSKAPNSRTNLLIKLLSLAPELNYNIEEIKTNSRETYNTLLCNIPEDTHEIEALPYDVYWLYFLEMLESKATEERKTALLSI